jgi:putative spermidine/putrescine transport system permease protein
MRRLSLFHLLLGAAVSLILLFLILPVLIVIPMSFSSERFLTFPPPSLSIRWYEEYLSSAAWMQATKISLTVALSTSIFATVLGTAAAYALSHAKGRFIRALEGLLLLPLVTPIIIVAVGVFLVYAKIGLLATLPGLILANVMLGIPFVVTSALAGFQQFDKAQEMVARSLGMNRLRSFFIVTLPQIRPNVITGALFAFISALDETVVALFISGGQNQTLTKRMFVALRDEIDPTIASISSLLTAASLLLVLVVALNAHKARAQSERTR